MAIENTYLNGEGVQLGTSHFDLQAQKPLDSRTRVPKFAGLQALIDGKAAYDGMIVYVEDNQKTYQAKLTDGILKFGEFASGTTSGGDDPSAVKFIPQTLTDEQKSQARENIGASSVGKSGAGENSEIFNNYDGNLASGTYSHAEGYSTQALGECSHAEGYSTQALGEGSHAEGYSTTAEGDFAHTEGWGTYALEGGSHAEGYATEATGMSSHAEGEDTKAKGYSSHAEGYRSEASENYSHAEGNDTIASGESSHAEGTHCKAEGGSSHAEGRGSTASDTYAHAEGYYSTASGAVSHAEGGNTTASGYYSHAEGYQTTAMGARAHAEGSSTNKVIGITSTTPINTIKSRWNTSKFSLAFGQASHVEGFDSLALTPNAHAEGQMTTASGQASHAEGNLTTASGNYSHAEGASTTASGSGSHAENNSATASGTGSHAEGYSTMASGNYSHAEGYITEAAGIYQHVQGKFNIIDTENTYAHIVGNGEDKNNRSNAHTLDWDGNAWFAGDVYVGSTSGANKDEGSKKLIAEDANGNVSITGNLTVKGTTYTQDNETLRIADNIIELNSTKVDNSTTLSGIAINKNENSTYGIMYDPTDDTVKFGEGATNAGEFSFNEGEGAPLAIRDDSNNIDDGAIMIFDKSKNKLVNSGYTIDTFKQWVRDYIESYMSTTTIIDTDGSETIEITVADNLISEKDGILEIGG